MILVRELDTDLVLLTGQQLYLQETVFRGCTQHTIRGLRQLASFRIIDGIDFEGTVLGEIGADDPLRRLHHSMNHCEIGFPEFVPFVLKEAFGRLVFREDENPGGFPVQTVYDEDPAFGFRVSFAHIVGQEEIGCLLPDCLGTHGQQTTGLIHYEDITVFMENRESLGMISPGR